MLSAYHRALQAHPLATKSMTSCLLAVASQKTSAYVSGDAPKSLDALAFAVYGLGVAGPLPHYFYGMMAKLVPAGSPNALLKQLAMDRLGFAPLMTFAFFFVTNLVKGKSLGETLSFIRKVFRTAIVKNWMFWTPAMILNLTVIPLEYRVLFASCVAFVWNVYLALLNKRGGGAKKPRELSAGAARVDDEAVTTVP